MKLESQKISCIYRHDSPLSSAVSIRVSQLVNKEASKVVLNNIRTFAAVNYGAFEEVKLI